MSVVLHKTLSEIAKLLGAELKGDPNCVISGIGTLQSAGAGQLSFLSNPAYKKHLATTKASAIILKRADVVDCASNLLIMDNPYLGYATIANLFVRDELPSPGIHSTAQIGERCQIDETASIGAYCVLGDDVVIGSGVVLGAHCVVGARSHIGANTRFWPRVTLYHEIVVGEKCLIHSGVVLGSDGFGMANDKGRWIKIPQLGTVIIGNEVEIGANTTIDRGALGNTIIEEGVKLDNQIQIGHNVRIGAYTAIAGCVAIAGSAVIGKHCAIGGGSCIAGHLTIADGVSLAGMTGIPTSIEKAGLYASGMWPEEMRSWVKTLARIRKLDGMARKIQKLEKLLLQTES